MLLYDLAVIFYTLGFAALLVSFYFNSKVLEAVLAAVLMSAIAMNAGAVLLRLNAVNLYSVADFIAMITLVLSCICFFINIKYQKSDIGLFVLPVVIVAGLLSFFFKGEGVSTAIPNMWIYIHIPLALIGTGFFITAFASGIMYVVLERQIKNKNFGKIFDRFPPLATIDRINSTSLYLGFVAYTAGLISAVGWMIFTGQSTAMTGILMKAAVAVSAWIIMGIIVLIKAKLGMTALQQAVASVVGFITMLITYASVALFMVGD